MLSKIKVFSAFEGFPWCIFTGGPSRIMVLPQRCWFVSMRVCVLLHALQKKYVSVCMCICVCKSDFLKNKKLSIWFVAAVPLLII